MSNDAKKITVRLSIEIPIDGSPPSVVTQRARESVSPRAMSLPSTLLGHIYYPAPDASHPVKVIGSGTSGVICAEGQATIFPFGYPKWIKGGCFPTSGVPDDPLGSEAEGPIREDGSWTLDNIPGAQCNQSSPGHYQILKVWYYQSSSSPSPVDSDSTGFYGYCSDQTGCESTNGPIMAKIYLPTSLCVSVSGFSDPYASFNKTWTLRIVPTSGNCCEVLWQRLPSTADEPEIKLVGSVEDRSACLIFKHRATTIQFVKKPGDWNPMNAVDFTEASCKAVPPGTSIPAIVCVRPG